jgi:UrcA family protein
MSISRILPMAIAALAISSTAAFAGPGAPDGESFKTSVRSADLNLNTDADAKVLLRRIQAAAGHQCGGEPNALELSRVRIYNGCVDAAVTETVARINNPRLTALASPSPASSTTLAQGR